MARPLKPGRAWLARNMAEGRRASRPVVLLGVVTTLAAIGQAWCIARLLAGAIGPAGFVGVEWALLFVALAVMRAALLVVSDDWSFAAGVAARRRLRTDLFVRLFGAGPAATLGSMSGERVAMAVDQVESLEGLFALWLPAAALAVVSPALIAFAVLLVDPWAALILVAAGLLVPVGMALAGLGAAAASQRQFVAMGRLQARFLDRIRGISTIVLAGRAEQEAVLLQGAADDLSRRTLRVLRVAFLSSAALDCAAAVALVVLAVRYAQSWHTETWTVGFDATTATFVLVLATEFFTPLRTFSAAYQDRMRAAGAADSMAALPGLPAGPSPLPIRSVTAAGVTVAFENLRFTWDPSRGPVLDGLSFRVPAGETVVLVGLSGAGKSTVIELLLGFVRPDSGRITLNGADASTIVPAAMARMTAWIGQRPVLFAGSIRDNIRFGREDATDRDVEDAAKAARIEQFAAGLPDGLDTLVGEGGYGLSGGQAQRVAIARAFVRNAPLLLLDEPTAHLDPATEADVLDSLRRLALGRTVILASHSAAAHVFGGRVLRLSEGRTQTVQGAA